MWSEFQRQEDLLLQCISLVFKTSRAPSYGHLWQLFIQNIYSFWLAQISWLILLNELAFTKFCSLWYPVYWTKSTVGHRQKRGCLLHAENGRKFHTFCGVDYLNYLKTQLQTKLKLQRMKIAIWRIYARLKIPLYPEFADE